MMEALRQYILGAAAASMICGGVLALVPDGVHRKLLRLLAGMVLTLCVLRPLTGLNLPAQAAFGDIQQGQALAVRAKEEMEEALAQSIKTRLEAYILDKAAALGAVLEVTVTLEKGEVPVPQSVTLRGQVSPYTRGRLEAILSSDLGIPKERQQWSG